MAKFLPFPITSFTLKAVLHLSLLAFTTLRCAKTDMEESPPFTFFMHDILGGPSPSERVVAGIIANTLTPNLPFSTPNNRVFPIQRGIPLVDTNTINGATSTTVISNVGKHNNVVIDKNTLPYVKAGTLPLGSTLEKLLFGRITVIDYEITQTHELGSPVIGKAQGFHLASSLDGSSLTMAFTMLFRNEDDDENKEDEEDTISFFGVHRRAANESYIAIVGGTGKYGNAKGYAKIETLHLPDHYTTSNGVETIVQTTVYITPYSSR